MFFGMSQYILPGASYACVSTRIGYTNRRQCFLDLVLPTDTKSSSLPTAADFHNKYPSPQSILLDSNYMAEPAQPLDINTLHNVYIIKELIQLNNG